MYRLRGGTLRQAISLASLMWLNSKDSSFRAARIAVTPCLTSTFPHTHKKNRFIEGFLLDNWAVILYDKLSNSGLYSKGWFLIN
jgi:hypothetical protein